MATEGGFGVNFQLTVGTSLTALTDVIEAELPEFERLVAEATPHSATGGWAKFISTGKRKMNEFKLTLGWQSDESTHAALVTAFDSEAAVAMQFTLPDSGAEAIAFSGLVTKMGRMTEQEDYCKCEVSIQPTGKPTLS